MKRIGIGIVLLLVAFGSYAGETLPFSVVMTGTPAHALPGAPPSLVVTMTNNAAAAVPVPLMALEVSKDGGAPFIAYWIPGDGLHSYVADYEEYQIAAEEQVENWPEMLPGTSREIAFAAGLDRPAWFCDVRMRDPGSYALRVYVSPDFRADSKLESPLHEHADQFAMAWSNPFTFVIDAPQGEDAAAWTLKNSLVGNTCGWSNFVAQKIWEQHPNSHYAAYNPPQYPGESGPAARDRVQEAIDKDPHGFMADRLRLLQADGHRGRQQRAFLVQPVDLARGIAEYDAYLAMIQQLASSDNPEVRFEAAVRLTHVVTHEQLTEVFNKLNGQSAPLQPVEPIVECVTRQRINNLNWKPVKARFGYNNPNATSVTLPFGEKNAFAPEPHDQGQPTTFLPGENPSAFTITAPKGTYLPDDLRWNLDGGRAGLPAVAPACTP